jgi:hypothetical protein
MMAYHDITSGLMAEKLIVVIMRADPKPGYRIAVEQANGTVLNANSRRV